MNQNNNDNQQGFIIKTVRTFLTGPLSMIFIALAVLLGIMAIFMTPARKNHKLLFRWWM